MALILAIEPERDQAALLSELIRVRLGAELVLADTTEDALVAIGDRVPDLVLVPALLSALEDATLAAALRVIAAAARVQMLTIPLLTAPAPAPKRSGIFARLRRRHSPASAPSGCDPAVFGEQIVQYLAESAVLRAQQAKQSEPAHASVDPVDDNVVSWADAEHPVEMPVAVSQSEPITDSIEEAAAYVARDFNAATTVEAIAATIDEPVLHVDDEVIVASTAVAPAIDEGVAVSQPDELILPDESWTLSDVAQGFSLAAVDEPIATSIDEPMLLLKEEAVIASPIDEAVAAATFGTLVVSNDPLAAWYVAQGYDFTTASESFLAEDEESAPIVQGLPTDESLDDPLVRAILSYQPEEIFLEEIVAATPCVAVEPLDPAVEEIVTGSAVDDLAPADHPFNDPAVLEWMVDDAVIGAREPLLRRAPSGATEIWTMAPPDAHDVVAGSLVVALEDPMFFCEDAATTTGAQATDAPVAMAVVPPSPRPEKPEWVELIESLREDIERLKADRTQAIAAVVPKHAQPATVRVEVAPIPPSRQDPAIRLPQKVRRSKTPKGVRPAEDEWGLFDPEQCGFASLLSKLAEITEAGDDGASSRTLSH